MAATTTTLNKSLAIAIACMVLLAALAPSGADAAGRRSLQNKKGGWGGKSSWGGGKVRKQHPAGGEGI